MSVFKRLFCLMLSIVLLFSLCACSEVQENKEPVYSKPQTITIEKVEDEEDKVALIPLSQEAAATSLAKQDFSGAEITYYTSKEPTEIQKLKLSAFSKAHNCSIKITLDTAPTMDAIASSIASGKPYDIVENDIDSFSKTYFYNIYQPLQSQIDTLDFYSSDRPNDLGISNAFASRFTINGNLLAVGSAESTDFYVLYYNRALFSKANFEDLYSMWSVGNLTFEELSKMSGVTSFASGDAFLQTPALSTWFNLRCMDILSPIGNSFSAELTQENFVSAATDYQNLIYGEAPMCIPKSSKVSFGNGKAYCMIDNASNYTYWKEKAKTSRAFDKNPENLGCVALPFDISPTGESPVANVRCYSTLKGAKNPTAAACFALYESRSYEIEKTQQTLPEETARYLIMSFNNSGFIPNYNFVSRDGKDSVYAILDDYGLAIRDGRNVKSMMTKSADEINTLISNAPRALPKVEN